MKKSKVLFLSAVSSIALALSACAQITDVSSSGSNTEYLSSEIQATENPEESAPEESLSGTPLPSSTPKVKEATQEATQEPTAIPQESAPKISESTFDLSEVESYAEQPYTVVNDNVPYFTDEDLTSESFEFYSD